MSYLVIIGMIFNVPEKVHRAIVIKTCAAYKAVIKAFELDIAGRNQQHLCPVIFKRFFNALVRSDNRIFGKCMTLKYLCRFQTL